MVLFDQNAPGTPEPPRRLTPGMVAGIWSLAVALVVLLVLTFLPTSYVIEQPGPVYDTLGTAQAADGTEVPLITVADAQTYPTAGSLDLLTVQVVGNRQRTPSWFELAGAWFDPRRAVLPIDAVFPDGQSAEERNEQSAALMIDSQKEATAAALTELGYDVVPRLTVYSLLDDSASAGILEEGDVIVSAQGEPIEDAATLREIINAEDGGPVEMQIDRSGELLEVDVTPNEVEVDGESTWLIGITLLNDYEFPVDVTIQLNNVGGPSAGMMFALGIIDVMTPDELNGGDAVAGTGTITADGTVGPIGGIRQKMWGARDAGADWFLAPETNCDEVVGHIPADLRVFSVETLDDALDVLETVREDGDLDALPVCDA